LTRRIIYLRLVNVENGYGVLDFLELDEGKWKDVDILFLYKDQDSGLIWTDETEFKTDAEVDGEDVPPPQNAVQVWEEFSAHIADVYGDDKNMIPVKTLAFIVTVKESENEA